MNPRRIAGWLLVTLGAISLLAVTVNSIRPFRSPRMARIRVERELRRAERAQPAAPAAPQAPAAPFGIERAAPIPPHAPMWNGPGRHMPMFFGPMLVWRVFRTIAGVVLIGLGLRMLARRHRRHWPDSGAPGEPLGPVFHV